MPSTHEVIALQKKSAKASAEARDSYLKFQKSKVKNKMGIITLRPSTIGSDRAADQQQRFAEAVKEGDDHMVAKLVELQSIFKRPVPASELFDLTDQSWQQMTKMARESKNLTGHFDDEKKKLDDYAVRLLELRALAKILRDKPEIVAKNVTSPIMPGTRWSKEYSENITAPLLMSRIMLKKAVSHQQKLEAILDLPSGILEYIGRQARHGLGGLTGLPEWFIPVTIGSLAIIAVSSLVSPIRSLVKA